MKSVYSCDTSALVQAWIKDYRPKTFRPVWDKLEELIKKGTLVAVDEVLTELKRKEDSLFKWAKAREGFFLPVDGDIQREVKAILAAHPRLVEVRRNRSGTDPFVIALARVRGAIVLTDEQPSGSIKKPKIPDVCSAMGIDCCSLADLFDRHNIAF